jgi:predicted nucleic acid-binding protein
MTVFVDTNILLDVLSHRQPFYEASAEVWSLAERGEVHAHISAISFNNIYYVIRKLKNRKTAEKALRLLRDIFESVAPDRQILNQSIDADFDDFEDAVQFHSALRAKVTCLITRNPRHFPRSSLPVLTPVEFLATLSQKD